MCGIAGFINYDSHKRIEYPQSTLSQMLAMIRHRGPDQFGMFLDEHAALGNARLSIVDLAGGQQPISTQDGRYWIVYNGEIFNHHELREELRAKGHIFATLSDTEVVLRLYAEEGPSCLKKFNGQFALAIWDRESRSLFIARDRLGIRPLFFKRDSDEFIFASEIKALVPHGTISLEIEPKALDQTFSYWSCQSPLSPFSGIEQLLPGHYGILKAQGLSIHSYWQPQIDGIGRDTRGEDELIEELDFLLKDAIRTRLLADVPVGSYLSGGLDSSLIASVARKYAGQRLDTFSIAFTDKSFDEREHQTAMADRLGTQHQVVEATAHSIGEIFPDVVWNCETLLLRTAPAPMFLLSRLVNLSGYKVVLTGEGADEFFAGYDIFKETKIREFWARESQSKTRPRLFERIYPDLENLSKLGPRYLSSFFGEGLEQTGAWDYSHRTRWKNTSRSKRFFSDDFKSDLESLEDRDNCPFPLPSDFCDRSILDRAQQLEIISFLSPYLLSSQGDRVAMANSVEGRYPFLDYRISEFSSRLPEKYRMPALKDKWLLRKLGKRYLPESVWNRGKKPYRAPIHSCFLGQGAPVYVKDILSEMELKKSGVFNPKPVSRLITKIENGGQIGETDDMALVGIISTQLLHQLFIESRPTIESLRDTDDVKICDFRSTKSMSAKHANRR